MFRPFAFAAIAMTVSACGGDTGSATPVSPPTPIVASATLASVPLAVRGVSRSMLVYTPAGLPAAAVPLVIVLHGGSEDAATTASEARPTKAWRDIADAEKFMVIYPDGIGNQWNDCRSDATGLSTADDVAFINGVIDWAAAQRAISPSQIYVTGPSNGGMMALRLGLELSTRIAGVGAVIANNPVDPMRVCPAGPARPVSVVLMNGTADPLVPYAGGAVAGFGTRGTVTSALNTRDFWISANRCSPTPVTDDLPDRDPTDGSTITREVYSGCRDGQRVVFHRIDGGGHTSPSLLYATTGRQNRDIESATEIWRFLKDARRN